MELSCCKTIVCFIFQNNIKAYGELYFLKFLHSFSTENKLKEYENVNKNRDYCCIEIPKQEIILKYNHEEMSVQIPSIIYANMLISIYSFLLYAESSLKETNTCQSNPENTLMSKINKHTVTGYSLFIHCSFDGTKKQACLLLRQMLYEKLLWRPKKACNKNNQL